MKLVDSFQPNRRKYYESLGENTHTSMPSIERPPQLKQKPLPSHLRYAYLGESSTLPIIVSASLIAVEKEKLGFIFGRFDKNPNFGSFYLIQTFSSSL